MINSIVLFAIFAISIALWVKSIVWAYGDAEKRGKSGVLVALWVALLSWPPGLLAWIAFRPSELAPKS